jgi:hypothetical protein
MSLSKSVAREWAGKKALIKRGEHQSHIWYKDSGNLEGSQTANPWGAGKLGSQAEQ